MTFGTNPPTGGQMAECLLPNFIPTFSSKTRLQVRLVDGFSRAIAQMKLNHTTMCLYGVVRISAWKRLTTGMLKSKLPLITIAAPQKLHSE